MTKNAFLPSNSFCKKTIKKRIYFSTFPKNQNRKKNPKMKKSQMKKSQMKKSKMKKSKMKKSKMKLSTFLFVDKPSYAIYQPTACSGLCE